MTVFSAAADSPRASGDGFAQGRNALGGAVLQHRRARLVEDGMRGRTDPLDWQQLRRRQPAGHREHMWLFGEAQQVTDCR